jgi:hypothetical protein
VLNLLGLHKRGAAARQGFTRFHAANYLADAHKRSCPAFSLHSAVLWSLLELRTHLIFTGCDSEHHHAAIVVR